MRIGWVDLPERVRRAVESIIGAEVVEAVSQLVDSPPAPRTGSGPTMGATLDEMARRLTPAPVPGLPTAVDRLAHDFAGWHRIAAEPPPDLDPWVSGHLAELCRLADHGIAALTGDSTAGGTPTPRWPPPRLTRGVDALDLTGALAGVAGFFADGGRLAPPPGLPTVRAFQRAQAAAALSWLRERLGTDRTAGR